VNAPLFDRAVIAIPGGKSIHISAPGASGPHHLNYIDGLSIDGEATDHTSAPESIVQTGGDLNFSLSAHPNKVWGTAESAAPPSFGAGSSAVTVNVSRPIVTIAPGATRTVTVDAQRMAGGGGGYNTSATSSVKGITAAPVSGQFASDGSAALAVAITVPQSVPEGYYLVYLTTTVGESARRSIVFVITATETDEP
jgi:hypothetical protein